MNENENLVPKRRFKEFKNTGTWEQRKLGDVVKNIGTGNSKFQIQEKSSDASYAILGSTSVIGYDNNFDFEGNFVLTARVGANAGTLYQHSGKVKISDNTVYIQSDNLSFLYNLLNRFDLKKLSFGTGQPLVKSSELKKLALNFPNKEEQEKIGNFFNQLDYTIALHLCKQRQLGLLKQRLIKEILPQSDSTLPHLRFANFRKPWEQHQLKEVLKVNSGRDYKHLNEGNIPVYGTGGYMLSVDGKLSDVDGIGLGRKGTIDKPQYLKAPFWTVDTLFYLTPSPNYDIYFLYTLIQNVNWKSMDESTGVPSLSKSVIERVTLTFPILEEQQKIGSFFREFDNTISLHQQKIAHLKALKSTILNKMFI